MLDRYLGFLELLQIFLMHLLELVAVLLDALDLILQRLVLVLALIYLGVGLRYLIVRFVEILSQCLRFLVTALSLHVQHNFDTAG